MIAREIRIAVGVAVLSLLAGCGDDGSSTAEPSEDVAVVDDDDAGADDTDESVPPTFVAVATGMHLSLIHI